MTDDDWTEKLADRLFEHLVADHGYQVTSGGEAVEWYAFEALHDELHRRGDYGPMGRHRERTL